MASKNSKRRGQARLAASASHDPATIDRRAFLAGLGSAGAVLATSIGAALAALAIFGPKLWALVG